MQPYDLTGKRLIPIVTHGSSGAGDSLTALGRMTTAKVGPDCLTVYSSDVPRARKKLVEFLRKEYGKSTDDRSQLTDSPAEFVRRRIGIGQAQIDVSYVIMRSHFSFVIFSTKRVVCRDAIVPFGYCTTHFRLIHSPIAMTAAAKRI